MGTDKGMPTEDDMTPLTTSIDVNAFSLLVELTTASQTLCLTVDVVESAIAEVPATSSQSVESDNEAADSELETLVHKTVSLREAPIGTDDNSCARIWSVSTGLPIESGVN